jgi:hypothetical protein
MSDRAAARFPAYLASGGRVVSFAASRSGDTEDAMSIEKMTSKAQEALRNAAARRVVDGERGWIGSPNVSTLRRRRRGGGGGGEW